MNATALILKAGVNNQTGQYQFNSGVISNFCRGVLTQFYFCLGSLFIFSWSSATVAQTTVTEEPDTVVITASALTLDEAALNQHVTVFTRKQIEQESPASMAEFLARRAGAVIDRGSRSGGFGSFFLRGADPAHVLILIDGVAQNDSLTSRGTAVDFNTLTLDDVERIEIVRGNSTLAHSGALAGVIQIFTRPTGDKLRVSAAVESGGEGLHSANASFAQGPLRASISSREDGLNSASGSLSSRSANLGYRQNFDSTLIQAQMRLSDNETRSFPDESGGAAYSAIRTLEVQSSDAAQVTLSLTQRIADNNSLELQLANFRRNSHDNNPGVGSFEKLPPVTSDSSYRRTEVMTRWRWQDDGWTFALGADHRNESGKLDSNIFYGGWIPANFEIDRSTNSLVAEVLKSFGAWSFQTGFRNEHTPDQKTLMQPALSFRYQLGDGLGRVGMAMSSSDKLPSFYALGNPLVGNPDLRPEQSRQVELYYASSESAPLKSRITLFQANYRDLVDWDPVAFKLINRARADGTGLELGISDDWSSSIRSYAQGTLMTMRLPDGAPPLRSRPHQQGSAGLIADLGSHWCLQSGVTYVGRRFDSSIPTGERWLDGYALVNASLTWKAHEWQFVAALDNAFNRKTEETIGTDIGGRRLRLALRWNL